MGWSLLYEIEGVKAQILSIPRIISWPRKLLSFTVLMARFSKRLKVYRFEASKDITHHISWGWLKGTTSIYLKWIQQLRRFQHDGNVKEDSVKKKYCVQLLWNELFSCFLQRFFRKLCCGSIFSHLSFSHPSISTRFNPEVLLVISQIYSEYTNDRA